MLRKVEISWGGNVKEGFVVVGLGISVPVPDGWMLNWRRGDEGDGSVRMGLQGESQNQASLDYDIGFLDFCIFCVRFQPLRKQTALTWI